MTGCEWWNRTNALAPQAHWEGYWNGAVPAGQLRFSHSRAMLVQQYLQAHFQLDPRNTGVVALKNLPPKNVHRAAWDGICIVVLRRG
jgi:hypothetical protein